MDDVFLVIVLRVIYIWPKSIFLLHYIVKQRISERGSFQIDLSSDQGKCLLLKQCLWG